MCSRKNWEPSQPFSTSLISDAVSTAELTTTDVGHANLAELGSISADRVSSTILLSTETSKQLLFCFDKGQELADHQTPNVAIIHLIDGHAVVRVAEQSFSLGHGGMVVIPPRVTHSVQATEPTRMLLVLEKETDA